MNQFRTVRYGSQPKVYTDEEIDDILHNANVAKTFGTVTPKQCQVCCRDTFGWKEYCRKCRDFYRQVVQSNRKLVCKSKAKNCLIDHSARWSNCAFCKYQKCLQIGMDQVPIKEKPTKAKETQIEPKDTELTHQEMIDKAVELKRKRLSVACTIAEIEGKFTCPDCLISFDGVRPLFQHLKQPHEEDYHRYSHVNQYGEELNDEDSYEEDVDGIDRFERATYHNS